MTPEERDLLLARYATGQLSDAELRQLRQAALEDQTVFEALAEEEELRDLFADPAARQQVVKALAPPGSLSLSSWRRPWTWAAAGSLAAVAILMVSVWRPLERSAEMAQTRPPEVPAAAAPPPTTPPRTDTAPKPASKPAPAVRANRVEPLVVAEQASKLAPPEAVELKKSADEAAPAQLEKQTAVKSEVAVAAAPPPAPVAKRANAPVPAQNASPAWSVRWYLETAGGGRTPLEPGAEIDRGATVLAEVRSTEAGAVQLTPFLGLRQEKEERDAGELVPPGQPRVFRWRLDQPGEQQLTVTWSPSVAAGRMLSPRMTMRDAAVAQSGFNESSPRSARISLRVR